MNCFSTTTECHVSIIFWTLDDDVYSTIPRKLYIQIAFFAIGLYNIITNAQNDAALHAARDAYWEG